jgi:hypothetical protein
MDLAGLLTQDPIHVPWVLPPNPSKLGPRLTQENWFLKGDPIRWVRVGTQG